MRGGLTLPSPARGEGKLLCPVAVQRESSERFPSKSPPRPAPERAAGHGKCGELFFFWESSGDDGVEFIGVKVFLDGAVDGVQAGALDLAGIAVDVIFP